MTRAAELSRALRLERTGDLRRRRWVLALSFAGAVIGQIVALFQMGVLRRLPDPPLGPFDSARVDASDYAYSRLRMPDGVLMAGTYAMTAALAAAGDGARARNQPLLPIAMAAKTAYDLAINVKLAREEWRDNHALCAYCQTATLLSCASASLALPEAARALRALLRR